MVFMDVGTGKYKKTFADYFKKYKAFLITILVVILYFFIKDLVTQRDILVYDTDLQYLYTIDSNKGKSINDPPIIYIPEGYVVIWYDNPEFIGTRVGFPYLVERDGGLYPKLLANFSSLIFEPNNGDPTFRLIRRYNSTIEAPEPPVKDGYIFVGWYEENSSTTYVFDTMPLHVTTLFARWFRDFTSD